MKAVNFFIAFTGVWGYLLGVKPGGLLAVMFRELMVCDSQSMPNLVSLLGSLV